MPLAVEATHTLFDTLQTALGELNIQVCVLEGIAYRRNSVVMHMRVLKEHQDSGIQEGGETSVLVEVFATRVRKSRIWAADVDLQRILDRLRFSPSLDRKLCLLFIVEAFTLLSDTAVPQQHASTMQCPHGFLRRNGNVVHWVGT